MHLARRPSVPRLLGVLVTAVLAVALLPASPAAAKNVKIDKRIFGVHDSALGSLGHGTVGSLRLWDTGTTWREIETSPGVFDFSRLDQIVTAAQAKNVEVTLVLGMTPDFYSPGGARTMPSDMTTFTRYVKAVVSRYKSWNGRRGIAAYQVWNEANVTNFWTGTPLQMAQLTKATWNAVKSVDKGALVVGPAFAARINEQIRGITRFAFARVDGVPAWKYVDAVSLNLYPLDKYGSSLGTPEKSMELLAKARKLLGFGGLPASKPIWNTEVNYGMRTGAYGGTKAVPISAARQAAYVIRTYLLNASRGVKRVHWYSWDMGYLPSGGTLGNTQLTTPADRSTLTLAGKAFGLVRGWMLGGKLMGASKSAMPCAKDGKGTYTCVIKYSGGVKRVYWNPTKRVKVTTAKSATFMVGVYGKRTSIKGGSKKTVDYRPVMVRSKS
jgi:hypothetical protein